MKTKKINPTNQKYIDWTIKYLSDSEYFNTIIQKTLTRITAFYLLSDKKQLLQQLKIKMTKGAIEHGGSLPVSYEAVGKELQEEYLDIIAYNMMHLFRFKENYEQK